VPLTKSDLELFKLFDFDFLFPKEISDCEKFSFPALPPNALNLEWNSKLLKSEIIFVAWGFLFITDGALSPRLSFTLLTNLLFLFWILDFGLTGSTLVTESSESLPVVSSSSSSELSLPSSIAELSGLELWNIFSVEKDFIPGLLVLKANPAAPNMDEGFVDCWGLVAGNESLFPGFFKTR
jgi:hypothetical protein